MAISFPGGPHRFTKPPYKNNLSRGQWNRTGHPGRARGTQGKAREGVPRAPWGPPGFPLGPPGPPWVPLASLELHQTTLTTGLETIHNHSWGPPGALGAS